MCNVIRMKKVEAIIRSERMPIVKEKLRQMGIGGRTIFKHARKRK